MLGPLRAVLVHDVGVGLGGRQLGAALSFTGARMRLGLPRALDVLLEATLLFRGGDRPRVGALEIGHLELTLLELRALRLAHRPGTLLGALLFGRGGAGTLLRRFPCADSRRQLTRRVVDVLLPELREGVERVLPRRHEHVLVNLLPRARVASYFEDERGGLGIPPAVAQTLRGPHPCGVTEARATLHDARGPAWTRALLPALGACGMLAGLYWWAVDGAALGADFFCGLALLLVAPLLLGRHRPQRARLLPHPARVEVRGAGLLTQTLHARDVLGAVSCASADGGETLALQRASRDRPTILELATAADAKRVKDALGIGLHTSGALRWPVGTRTVDRLGAINRLLGACAAAMLAYATTFGRAAYGDWPLAYLVVVFPLVALATLRWRRARSAERSVWMTPTDVRLEDARGGWTAVPYAALTSARFEDGWLVVGRGTARRVATKVELARHGRRGITRAELEVLMAQLRAAGQRARGVEGHEAHSGAAAPLARAHGEEARAWLARLETTALQLARGTSYRDIAFAEGDLWAALEDHDAEPALRAACARVLSRVSRPGERARIDAIVSCIRDDDAKTRIRVALDPDLDRAVRELEDLDALDAEVRDLHS